MNSNNSIYNSLEGLDIITIAGFLMQVQNIQLDKVQNKYIHENIERIESELNKINLKLDLILDKIGMEDYNGIERETKARSRDSYPKI